MPNNNLHCKKNKLSPLGEMPEGQMGSLTMPHDQAYLETEKKIKPASRLDLRELNLGTEWYEKNKTY